VGQDSTVREIGRRCSAAGVESSVSSNVMRHKWSKLALNCANAVYAITDRGAESFGTDRALRLATDLVIDEANAALRLARIPHYRSRPTYRASVGGHAHKSSTWVDFLRRRGKSEVPWLNGEIVRLGRQLGFPTPANSLLLEISDQMVHSGAVPGRYTTTQLLELLRERVGRGSE
jgi:2-dehydropantoate 2-reductase